LRVHAPFCGEASVAPNKRKILEAARKHAQKGSKDRALKEYEKLLKLDPRDAKLRLEIGDAHRRWGQVEEAVAAYSRVADQYMKEGFDARAVAVYKQIHSLDPERFDSYVPLADLYQRMGLASEAIQALQTAADGFHKQGKKREALELLRKMATLDPSNTTSRIKVADLLRQEGMEPEAIAEYEAARAELERQGETEAAGKVLERVLEIDPKHLPSLVSLAQNLLGRGLAESAEPFAKQALEVQGDEVAHYELLADIYRAQQRDDEMAGTYRRLADLYRERGDEDKAREIIQRFAPPEFTAPIEPDAGDTGAAGSEEPTLLDDELLDGGDALGAGDLSLEDEAADLTDSMLDDDLLDIDEEMPEAAAAISSSEQVDELDPIEGDPEQLLAEASVYLRYGKRAQAIRNLEAILALEPGHRGALEKLGEAHADADDTTSAVDAWQRAAASACDSNDLSGFGVLRDRIAALDPNAAEALGDGPVAEIEEDLIEFEEEEEASDGEAPEEVVEELDLDDDIEIDLDPIEEEASGRSATLQAAAAEVGAGTSAVAKQKIQDEIDEAEFYHQQGLFEEARTIYERVLKAAPNHPMALVRMGEIDAAQTDDPEPTSPAIEAREAREEPPTVEERPALDIDIDVDLDEDVDEWTDSDVDDDSVDLDAGDPESVTELPDTEEIEVELPDVDLEEPEVDALLEAPATGEVELPEVDPAAPEVAASEPEVDIAGETPIVPDRVAASLTDEGSQSPVALDVPDDVVAEGLAAGSAGESFDDLLIEANADETPDAAGESFDLAAELADAFDDASSSSSSTGNLASMSEQDVFAAVFSEFKKGVDKALGEGDHEAHYDLGIAYREMGLLDDALGEFSAASQNAARRVDCLHLMGLCAIDLGRAEEATVHLQQALDTPDLNREQTLGVQFELGRAFEVLEDLDRARAAWQTVADVDPSFCEVQERLASLGEAKPEPAADDMESFDDLFDDDDDDGDTSDVSAEESGGESFDDLVAEANDADLEDSGVSEVPAAPAPPAATDKPSRRKKKKISFV
jgi:pilus assembly protein FimV